MKKYKIAIVVHGRFHAFSLATALLRLHHEVVVFTNYPKWAAKPFGLPGHAVQGYWLHGLVARCCQWFAEIAPQVDFSAILHRSFGDWAAERLNREQWDAIYVFSGVAEEVLRRCRNNAKIVTVVRGSAHILAQDHLLAEEVARVGVRVERPSKWMIARELREYELAERITVLSSFARTSFLVHGVAPDKVGLLCQGVDGRMFRPSEELVASRCRRIRRGEPLRILFVGMFCYRKGIQDFAEIVRALSKDGFLFRCVGYVEPAARRLRDALRGSVEFVPRLPQNELPSQYAWGDIFVFPTIEDGFPAVLSQALASGLPVLTTTNCSGPDIVQEGETGWILPIRSPAAFVDRLHWCNAHRDTVAATVLRTYRTCRVRDWDEAAQDFTKLIEHYMAASRGMR
jgi:glycosyltransferase involved in cell wall biosynthesis